MFEGEPGQRDGGDDEEQAEVAEAEMDLLEVGYLLLAGLLALAVLGCGAYGVCWGGL